MDRLENIYRAIETAMKLSDLDGSDRAVINALLDVMERCNFSDPPRWAQGDPNAPSTISDYEEGR